MMSRVTEKKWKKKTDRQWEGSGTVPRGLDKCQISMLIHTYALYTPTDIFPVWALGRAKVT